YAGLAAAAQHQSLGGAPQGRGRRGGQWRPADDRRGLRPLSAHARGVRLVAARGRPIRHAGPPGDAHPALPRPLRTPAEVLILGFSAADASAAVTGRWTKTHPLL